MLRAIEQKREAIEAGRPRLEFPEALPRKRSPTRRALPLDCRSLILGGGAGRKARLPRMRTLSTPYRQKRGRSDFMNAIFALVPVSTAHGSSLVGTSMKSPSRCAASRPSPASGSEWSSFAWTSGGGKGRDPDPPRVRINGCGRPARLFPRRRSRSKRRSRPSSVRRE